MLPNRKEIVDWFRANQDGQKDYVFIPPGMSNAFIGILAGTANPSIAILDFNQVVRNLMANHDLSYKEAYQFAFDKASNGPAYGPMLVVTYPEQPLQPKTNFKSDDCPF